MEALKAGIDLDSFFDDVRGARARILLLDYDGTLAPFRVERDRALPHPEVRRALERVVEEDTTRVVVVSGRPAHEVRALLDLEPPPEIWGAHGWERLDRGGGAVFRHSLPDTRRERLDHFAVVLGRDPRLHGRVERKAASVAVHLRGLLGEDAIAVERAVRASADPFARDGGESDLELHDFDGGVELRSAGRDKGTAVREILSETPEDAVVAYLGDDLTDEDAFEALAGRGLRVLVRSEPRPTAADLRLDGHDEVAAFLDRWAAATVEEDHHGEPGRRKGRPFGGQEREAGTRAGSDHRIEERDDR